MNLNAARCFSETLDSDEDAKHSHVRLCAPDVTPWSSLYDILLRRYLSSERRQQIEKQSHITSFRAALDACMQSFGAHGSTAGVTALHFVGPPLISRCLVVIRRPLLVFCLLSLPCISSYTAGVFYWASSDLLYPCFSPHSCNQAPR